jgi:hypothetical protein
MRTVTSFLLVLLSCFANAGEKKQTGPNDPAWILLKEEIVDLGKIPILDQRVKFPLDLPGDLYVQGYTDRYSEALIVTARPAPGIPTPPKGLTYCYTTIPIRIELGSRCLFWVAPLLDVSWYRQTVDKEEHVFLSIKVYAASKK